MQDIERYKALIIPVLKRYCIKRAAIFGSVAKGISSATSDVDLLIEGQSDFTLFQLLMLQDEISDLVSRKVDLVEYGAIKWSIRNEVLRSAVSIL